MANSPDIKVTWKADMAQFNSEIKKNQQEMSRLNKELKLQQTEMKSSGSDIDKLASQLSSLEKQYALAQEKTRLTAEQLDKARAKFGENSQEAAKLESQLLTAQTAEARLANAIQETGTALDKAKSQTTDYAQKLKTLEAEEEKLNGSAEKAAKQFQLQQEQLAQTGSKSQQLQSNLAALGTQYNIAQQQTANLRQQLELAKSVYGENSEEVRKLEDKLLDAEISEQKFANEVKATTKELVAQGGKLGDVGDKMKEFGKKLDQAGQTLTRNVTTPILGIGTAAVVMAANFEAGMSEVEAISGATASEMSMLEDVAEEMGATTKFSASEAAEGLKYMAMAGWDANAMAAALPGVMNLAASSGENLGTVSDIVTDAMTAFGLQAEEAAHFADVLAVASSASNTNVGLLGESFKYVAPMAGQLGYSIEDTAHALGLMANSGIKGSQAGTALNQAFMSLLKPSDKAREIMDEFGLSLSDTDGKIKPLNVLMDELRSMFGGAASAAEEFGISLTDANGEAKENEQLISELVDAGYDYNRAMELSNLAVVFGTRGLSAMLPIIGATEEEYNKLSVAIDDSSGAAERMAGVMMDNLQGRLTILKSNLEGVAIQVGNILIPHIEKLVSWVGDAVTWFGNLNTSTQETILKVAGIAAAVGPLLIIGGKITTGIGSILKVGGQLGTFILTTVTQLGTLATGGTAAAVGVTATGTAASVAAVPVAGFGAAMSSALLPLLAIATVVAAAVGAFAILKNSTDQGRESFIDYSDAITDNSEKLARIHGEVKEEVIAHNQQLAENFKTWSGDITASLDTVAQATGEELPVALQGLEASVGTSFGNIKDIINNDTQEAVDRLYEYGDLGLNTVDENGINMAGLVKVHSAEKIAIIDEAEARVNEIISTAADEGRSLTAAETTEINSLWATAMAQIEVDVTSTYDALETEADIFFEKNKELNKETLEDFKTTMQEKTDTLIEELDSQYKENLIAIEKNTALSEKEKEDQKALELEKYSDSLANLKSSNQDQIKEFQNHYLEKYGLQEKDIVEYNNYKNKLMGEVKSGNKTWEQADLELRDYRRKNLNGMEEDTIGILNEVLDATDAHARQFTAKMGKGATDAVTSWAAEIADMSPEFQKELDKANVKLKTGNDTMKATASAGGTGIAANLGSSFTTKMNSVSNSMVNTAAGVITKTVNAMKKAAGIASPSKETQYIADMMFAGFTKGIDKNENSLIKDMTETATKMVNAFNGEFEASLNYDALGTLADTTANIVAANNYNNPTVILNPTVRSQEDIRLLAKEVNRVLGGELG